MTEVTIDSYSKKKLWGIVQQQGHVVAVIAQTLLSPKSDREVRGLLIDLLCKVGAIQREGAPKSEAQPAIVLPDAPVIEVVKA